MSLKGFIYSTKKSQRKNSLNYEEPQVISVAPASSVQDNSEVVDMKIQNFNTKLSYVQQSLQTESSRLESKFDSILRQLKKIDNQRTNLEEEERKALKIQANVVDRLDTIKRQLSSLDDPKLDDTSKWNQIKDVESWLQIKTEF